MKMGEITCLGMMLWLAPGAWALAQSTESGAEHVAEHASTDALQTAQEVARKTAVHVGKVPGGQGRINILVGDTDDGLMLVNLSRRDVRLLQERLKEKGLYDGDVDGVYGPRTGEALQAFVRERLPHITEVAQETRIGAPLKTVAP